MGSNAALIKALKSGSIKRVRFAWADIHGGFHSKCLQPEAALRAFKQGIGVPGTLMLKDHADKTAFPVFDADSLAQFPFLTRFAQASNIQLKPLDLPWHRLPHEPSTAWVRCEPFHGDGTAVAIEPRRHLQQALAKLQQYAYSMHCGLEVEFHIYKITDESQSLNPSLLAWPAGAPVLQALHPGYRLLSDEYHSACSEALGIVEQTCLALGLPLESLEIEFGPSQFEAVFKVTDAMQAADNMLLFRNFVRQALRQKGYYASFACRPPFENIMSSGWHLHQSLQNKKGQNIFATTLPSASQGRGRAKPMTSDLSPLSPIGQLYLAGLLHNASAMAALCVPTLNGFERFRPNALAPQKAVWGMDNRGAMLRVIGAVGDAATRIENRLGEPVANPYLYMASQIYAGLQGIDLDLPCPPASDTPYKTEQSDKKLAQSLPKNMAEALHALQSSAAFQQGFGSDFIAYYYYLKKAEIARQAKATDKTEFQARDYFARF